MYIYFGLSAKANIEDVTKKYITVTTYLMHINLVKL